MLQNLHVKNLALIDECEVEFEDGLNILSGETGAGESIIIGSINLALASMVPPVAIKSSTITTFCPGLIESTCISISALPYSNSYEVETVSQGSFPFLRIKTNGLPK